MRIQHNIMAMNAFRNYNTNTSALGRNLEKLSSGYKINRAGDDAAGLAISEKMRAQISGLKQAQSNVKDGISLVKTAEGALQEVQDMLNRMTTLATQSANGTYDNNVDRNNLQKEVKALAEEIDRIADSSNFNGTKLLDGSMGSAASVGDVVPGTAAEVSMTSATAEAAALTNAGLSGVNVLVGDQDDTVSVQYTAETYTSSTGSVADSDTKTSVSVTGDDSAILNGKKVIINFAENDLGDGTAPSAEAELSNTGDLVITLTGNINATNGDNLAEWLTDADAIQGAIESALGTGGASIDGSTYTEADAAEVLAAWKEAGITVALQENETFAAPAATASIAVTMAGGGELDDAAKLTLTIGSDEYEVEATAADGKFAAGEISFTDDGGNEVASLTTDGNATKLATTSAAAVQIGTLDVEGEAKGASVEVDFAGKTGAGVIGSTITVGNQTFEFVAADGDQKAGNVAVVVAEDAAGKDIADAFADAFTGSKYKDVDGADAGTVEYTADSTKVKLTSTATGATAEAATIEQIGKGLGLQIGDTAESYNQLSVKVGDMHTKALGVAIDQISVATQEDAAKAIEAIKTAINTVSCTRGDLGAIQNRLEHTTNNLAIMTENIQDAESTIRDVDIADEMTSYTKNNILLQSAQAMLAQANQMPQGVLQLLQ